MGSVWDDLEEGPERNCKMGAWPTNGRLGRARFYVYGMSDPEWYMRGEQEVVGGSKFREKEFVMHVPPERMTDSGKLKVLEFEGCGYSVRMDRSVRTDGWIEIGLLRKRSGERERMRGKLLGELSDAEFAKDERKREFGKSKVPMLDRDYKELDKEIDRLTELRSILQGKND